MKATINRLGVITISPESEVEAYALSKWGEDAISHTDKPGNINTDTLIIETIVKDSQ